METTIRLTQQGHCKIRNLYLYPSGLTDLTEVSNQDFLGDDTFE